MFKFLENILVDAGVKAATAQYAVEVTLLVLLLIVAVISKMITDKIFKTTLSRTIRHKKYKWHNILVRSKFFRRLSHFVPIAILYSASPFFITYGATMRNVLNFYILFVIMMLIDSFLTALNDVYNTLAISKKRPIKGLIQIAKIAIYCVVIVVVIAHLLGQSPAVVLGSVGAFTAILMLIFKDPIVGFVSGVQIAANDMVRIGDWVEMPKYDANGEVIDISLTTIKVENFDNTITTVPTYAFISDSFKNWRRMQERGGRRIKRSILIDINSIKFCTPELLEKFKEIDFVADYVISMEQQLEEYNKQHDVSFDELFNGIHLTNIGVFRIYLQNYLNHNEFIHQDMAKIVRQLDPEENGLPLEIYTFSTLTEWADYEKIQSDLFDHIIAIAPEFDLRIYQSPSSSDFDKLSKSKNH